MAPSMSAVARLDLAQVRTQRCVATTPRNPVWTDPGVPAGAAGEDLEGAAEAAASATTMAACTPGARVGHPCLFRPLFALAALV